MGEKTPASPAVPNATPPPSANNAASLAVEQATYRQQLRRKSISGTIFAGANALGGSSGMSGTQPPTPPK